MYRLTIPRLTDKVLIDILTDFAETACQSDAEVYLLMPGSNRRVNIPYDVRNEHAKDIDTLKKKNISMAKSFHYSFSRKANSGYNNNYKVSLDIKRGCFSEEVKSPDPIWDYLSFNIEQHNSFPDITANYEIQFGELIKKLSVKRATSKNPNGYSLAELNALHLSSVERFENSAADAVQHVTQLGSEMADKYCQQIADLEQDFLQKKEELRQKEEALQSTLKQDRAQFEKEKESFNELKNTYERRGIHKRVLKEIKERQAKFLLTDDTNKKRYPIFSFLICLIGVSGYLSYSYGVDFASVIKDSESLSANTLPLLILGIRQVIFSLAFLGTGLFTIRWMNHWAERHAMAEFRNKEFEFDMERAGWLVEATLEWNEKKDGEIPEKLIENLSRGLFDTPDKLPPIQHPADQLASALMGTASKVDLNLGRSSVSLDGKKLSKVKPSSSEG